MTNNYASISRWKTIALEEDLGLTDASVKTIGYKITDRGLGSLNGAFPSSYRTHELTVSSPDGGCKTPLLFESRRPRPELLAEMARIYSREHEYDGLKDHGSDYRISVDYELMDKFLDRFSGDLEVASFVVFLFHVALPFSTDLEDLRTLAEEHVQFWRGREIKTAEDAEQYWNPKPGQWQDSDLTSILDDAFHEISRSKYKRLLDGCEDAEYRNFVKVLFRISSLDEDLLLKDALGSIPVIEEARGLVESLDIFFELRLEYPAQRELLKEFTLEEIKAVSSRINLRNATLSSAPVLLRDQLEYMREEKPMHSALDAYRRFSKVADHFVEANTLQRVLQAYLNNAEHRLALDLISEFFESVPEKVSMDLAEETIDLVFGGLVPWWAADFYHVDYVLGLLKGVGMSPIEIFQVIDEIASAQVIPVVESWESYVSKYSELKDFNIALIWGML